MNGRVFDPVIGTFVSADPYIDGAHRTQGWNRYAYVGNRPLSDRPTGRRTARRLDFPTFCGHISALILRPQRLSG
jgi:hypothetical protein